MIEHNVDIMIVSKDRANEICLLLQSLRTQTFKNFDIFIYDDRSQQPYFNNYNLMSIVNRMKIENHNIEIIRNEINYGVTRLRQIAVDKLLKDSKGDLILRLDDDNLLEPDFVERLVKTIDSGYDIASCIVPVLGAPDMKRDTKFVKPFIMDIQLDKEGNIIYFADDCGYSYVQKEIIPTQSFRSMALMKKEVHKNVQYPLSLGNCSFREEQFFSFLAVIKGYKLAVDTGAIAYHINVPSGGERTQQYYGNIQQNHVRLNELSKELFKQYGNWIEKYNSSLGLTAKKRTKEEIDKFIDILTKIL